MYAEVWRKAFMNGEHPRMLRHHARNPVALVVKEIAPYQDPLRLQFPDGRRVFII